ARRDPRGIHPAARAGPRDPDLPGRPARGYEDYRRHVRRHGHGLQRDRRQYRRRPGHGEIPPVSGPRPHARLPAPKRVGTSASHFPSRRGRDEPMSSRSEQDFERLSAYIDNELEPAEKADLEARLATEPELKAGLDDLRRMVSALRALPIIKP